MIDGIPPEWKYNYYIGLKNNKIMNLSSCGQPIAIPDLAAAGIYYLGLHGVTSQPGLQNSIAPMQLRAVLEAAKQQGWALNFSDSAPHRMILTFDDGRAFDSELTDILDEYDVTAIFFVSTADSIAPTYAKLPCFRAMSQQNRMYISAHHIVGSHTKSHSNLGKLSIDAQAALLAESFEEFSDLFGARPICFSYPWGEYNRHTLNLLDQQGIEFAFLASPGRSFRRPHRFMIPRVFMDNPNMMGLGFAEYCAAFDRPVANLKLAIRELHAACALHLRRKALRCE
jgi:peptidoglycan/xylan/chitin deacetylase (PgdA/CDA1 family)